jgi:hypothetical protein
MTNIGNFYNHYGGQNKMRVDELEEDEGTRKNKLRRIRMMGGWM